MDQQQILDAAAAFGDAFTDDILSDEIGPKLTCEEAEIVADLLRATGHPEAAVMWIKDHSLSDDEGDAHYLERVAYEAELAVRSNP